MKGVEKMIAKEEYQINIKLLEEEKDVNDFEKDDTSQEIKRIDIPLSLSNLISFYETGNCINLL